VRRAGVAARREIRRLPKGESLRSDGAHSTAGGNNTSLTYIFSTSLAPRMSVYRPHWIKTNAQIAWTNRAMPPEMMAPMKTSAVGKRRSGTSVCTARYAATVSSWATSDEKKHFTHHVRRKRAGRGQSMCRRPPLRQPRVTTGSSSAPGKDVAISDTSVVSSSCLK